MKKEKPSAQPCIVCNKTPTDRCHIKSKGAGGSMDDDNILMMCREHHQEQHKIGWAKFSYKYIVVQLKLRARGWKIEPVLGVLKLVRIDA